MQEDRRVWGDVPGGVLLGEVAADGFTLRGAWANGLVELRLSQDGQSVQGRWGRGLDPLLGQSEITGQRLSGGTPNLQRATGADSDLPETLRGAAFDGFMAPARKPASGDIDQMQANASAPNFGGVWATNHQVLTLHQQGRRVWGERDRGTVEGELSADGRTLRGTWTNGNDWGTLEFVMGHDGRAFSGRWGYSAVDNLGGGTWNGTRRSYLSPELQRDTAQAQARHPSASDAALDAFLTPVRDPDLPGIAQPDPASEPQKDASAPGGFEPAYRADFNRPDGSLAISFVFARGESGGEAGGYTPGRIWLTEGWCGTAQLCPEEILTTGGPNRADTPTAIDRVLKGGVIPGTSSTLGQIAFEIGFSGALDVHVLTGPYDDATQLGPNRTLIAGTFGGFQMGDARPANLDGWPIVEPARESEPTPVQIGAIDVMPVGVFAAVEGAPGEPAVQVFERVRSDGSLLPELALQCAEQPIVFYPDGLLAVRYLDSLGASQGRAPYTTETHEICEQSGPILTCENFIGAPGRQNSSIPNGSFTIVPAAGPDGMFAQSIENDVYVYTPCYGPNGFLSATELAPDGVPMWQHVVRRDDGGQGIEILADGTARPVALSDSARAVPDPVQTGETANSADFTAFVGIWAPAESSDPLDVTCYETPLVGHADGRFEIFRDGLDEAGLPTRAQDYLQCTDVNTCQMMRGGAMLDRMASTRFSLNQLGADKISLCAEGEGCVEAQRCAPIEWSNRERASGLAARWDARVMERN